MTGKEELKRSVENVFKPFKSLRFYRIDYIIVFIKDLNPMKWSHEVGISKKLSLTLTSQPGRLQELEFG